LVLHFQDAQVLTQSPLANGESSLVVTGVRSGNNKKERKGGISVLLAIPSKGFFQIRQLNGGHDYKQIVNMFGPLQ